jgi:hypothetical protein
LHANCALRLGDALPYGNIRMPVMIGKIPPAGLLRPIREPPRPCRVPLHDPEPLDAGRPTSDSFGTMETSGGDTGLSAWGDNPLSVTDAGPQVALQLSPGSPIVIGRQETGIAPYVDPAYRSTRVVPGTGKAIVRSASKGYDVRVSRAHFMLRGNGGGIMLTNGVPRRGGGIRPPMNGTLMLLPIHRPMEPGEEYLIEHGANVALGLPNGTVVRICAE